jgi:molybdopterin synthase catalytic subunit
MAGSIVLACNQEFAGPGTALKEGDEIALMPPVSGGSDPGPWIAQSQGLRGSFYGITREVIDVGALREGLLAGEDGALITFEGVVRNHSGGRRALYLDYECYVPLALKKMEEIGSSILETHAVRSIAIVHRLGRLEIGETSVAIVVAAGHRGPAYQASLEAINRLKRLVPIWKKEYFEDGEVWVEGDWESSVPRPAGTPQ